MASREGCRGLAEQDLAASLVDEATVTTQICEYVRPSRLRHAAILRRVATGRALDALDAYSVSCDADLAE